MNSATTISLATVLVLIGGTWAVSGRLAAVEQETQINKSKIQANEHRQVDQMQRVEVMFEAITEQLHTTDKNLQQRIDSLDRRVERMSEKLDRKADKP